MHMMLSLPESGLQLDHSCVAQRPQYSYLKEVRNPQRAKQKKKLDHETKGWILEETSLKNLYV